MPTIVEDPIVDKRWKKKLEKAGRRRRKAIINIPAAGLAHAKNGGER